MSSGRKVTTFTWNKPIWHTNGGPELPKYGVKNRLTWNIGDNDFDNEVLRTLDSYGALKLSAKRS